MGLLNADSEEPKAKVKRYLITAVVLAILVSTGVWYVFRYHTEKKAVERFMATLVAEDFQGAYELWKGKAGESGQERVTSYTFERFMDDWGPSGYYGPIRSFEIVNVEKRNRASGVVVAVLVSPDAPFPPKDDVVKRRRVTEVQIWVESSDQSLSFPP